MAYGTYTIQKTYEGRALLLSFFLHASVIVFYFYVLYPKSIELTSSKTVVLEISNIERVAPTPVEPTPPPPEPVVQQEVKKIEPIKPIEPVKPKPIPKPKSVQHEVVPTPVPEPVQEAVTQSTPTPVVATPSPVATPTSTQSEPYVKTDFEIIRDKVLSRLVYPSIARRMSWTGVVHVALVIDTDGKLVGATIHQSSGKSVLDDAALEAAFKLKSDLLPKPQRLSTVILPIAFKLK